MSTYPDTHQTLLLKAALLEGDEARACILAWTTMVDLAQVDWASQRLIPLLYENIRSQGMEPEHNDLLKGVHRYWWFRNTRNISRLKKVITHMQQHGVAKIMLLKGAAMASFYYGNVALRPMNDIDILVKPGEACAAMESLLEADFKPLSLYRGPVSAQHIYAHFTRMGFFHPDYGELDLHWEILTSHNNPAFDASVWGNAERRDLDGLAIHTPCAADLLIHVIDHGLMENVMQPIWWVADAQAIIDQVPQLDWHYFFGQAAIVNRVGIMQEGLEWLQQNLSVEDIGSGPPVPRTTGDRFYFLFRDHVTLDSKLFRIHRLLDHFSRYCSVTGRSRNPRTLSNYLQQKWELQSKMEIPARILQSWRRLD